MISLKKKTHIEQQTLQKQLGLSILENFFEKFLFRHA